MKTLPGTILLLAAFVFIFAESISAETEKPVKDTKHVSVTTRDASQEKSASTRTGITSPLISSPIQRTGVPCLIEYSGTGLMILI